MKEERIIIVDEGIEVEVTPEAMMCCHGPYFYARG
jgi:hypothetical protein